MLLRQVPLPVGLHRLKAIGEGRTRVSSMARWRVTVTLQSQVKDVSAALSFQISDFPSQGSGRVSTGDRTRICAATVRRLSHSAIDTVPVEGLEPPPMML